MPFNTFFNIAFRIALYITMILSMIIGVIKLLSGSLKESKNEDDIMVGLFGLGFCALCVLSITLADVLKGF